MKLDKLEKIITARVMSKTLVPATAISTIVAETCNILQCDRATVYTLSPRDPSVMSLHTSEGELGVTLPSDQGISGTVVQGGKLKNVKNAYQDPLFDSSHDKATGYETKTILCAPIIAHDGNIVGAIQAINKNGVL